MGWWWRDGGAEAEKRRCLNWGLTKATNQVPPELLLSCSSFTALGCRHPWVPAKGREAGLGEERRGDPGGFLCSALQREQAQAQPSQLLRGLLSSSRIVIAVLSVGDTWEGGRGPRASPPSALRGGGSTQCSLSHQKEPASLHLPVGWCFLASFGRVSVALHWAWLVSDLLSGLSGCGPQRLPSGW